MKFEILKGKKLGAAIKGREKVAKTFTEREHQLALSCIHHVEEHHCPEYLNRLYTVTPQNYRGGLIGWAKAHGKVKFDSKAGTFAFVKGKKSDLDGAAKVAPANFQKVASTGATEAKFDEIKEITKLIERFTEKKAKPSVIRALKAALNVAEGKGPAPAVSKTKKATVTPIKPVATPAAAPVKEAA